MKATLLAFLSLFAASAIVQASPISSQRGNGIRDIRRRQPPKHLIQTSADSEPKWLSESDILGLIQKKIKFMDITHHQDLDKNVIKSYASAIPTEPKYQSEVKPVIDALDTNNMKTNLEGFIKFNNRYYKSTTGAESSKWLLQQVTAAAKGSNVTVKAFTHRWAQSSVIARFEGSDPSLSNQVVVIGAHQDSINQNNPTSGRAPGADDDGSGTVTILETFRSLVQNNFKPERPVEFQWYAAEEAGLLGSQDIASAYQSKGIEVVGMLQNDMTGYIGDNGQVVGVVTDFVDDQLTGFVKKLVETYLSIPYKETQCGYGCSDHASFTKAGYPSAFTIESLFDDSNQYIHSEEDTIEKVSFDHMKEFSKLAAGFAVELSHK
ncbi:unnamed protein product [Cunninghamella echinulata]